MQALERTLYRSVRRLAQHLDASAARRGALTALPANYYDRQARMVVDMEPVERDADDAARAADDAVDHLVREANGGSEFYVPGRGEALTAALTRAAREFESDSFDGAELGMAALRRLGRVAALAGAMNSRRGGLRARNPAELPLKLDDASPVSVGDVLVAHPMSCLSQPTLHGAVILLVAAEEAPADDDSFEASGDPPVLGREGGFVMGLVVNKRSGVTLADAATEHGMAALDNELLASELFVGGDVSSRTLTGVSDVADDSLSEKPKWFTDDVTALEGKSRIFCGYCGWSTAQLENELARGVWFRARAPHTVRGDAAHRVVKAPPPPAAVPVTPTRRTTWRRKAKPSTYDDAPSRNVVHPVTPPASPPKAPPPALELPPPLFLPPEPPTKADDDYWGHFLDLDPAEEQDSYWFSHTRAAVTQ